MVGPSWLRVEELFWAALDHPAGERAAFLESECGGDERLRLEVESLLAADAADGADPLRGSAAEALARAVQLEAQAWEGQRVGPYRVVRRIGQGGMGTVYLAERDDVEMRVALKVVRAVLGAPDLVPRFLAERRVLARLEHPGIARLLDAGISGRARARARHGKVDGRRRAGRLETAITRRRHGWCVPVPKVGGRFEGGRSASQHRHTRGRPDRARQRRHPHCRERAPGTAAGACLGCGSAPSARYRWGPGQGGGHAVRVRESERGGSSRRWADCGGGRRLTHDPLLRRAWAVRDVGGAERGRTGRVPPAHGPCTPSAATRCS